MPPYDPATDPTDPMHPALLGATIRLHWKDSDPFKYRRLYRRGTLDLESADLARQVIEYAQGLMGNGTDRIQATSEALRELVFLPVPVGRWE